MNSNDGCADEKTLAWIEAIHPRDDLIPLREAGLDDRGILEVVEVTAYYNFVNRLADRLGVTLEPGWPNAGD